MPGLHMLQFEGARTAEHAKTPEQGIRTCTLPKTLRCVSTTVRKLASRSPSSQVQPSK